MARPSITQLPPTGLDRFRGLLTRADDLTGGLLAAVPGIGTLAALNRSGNAAQSGDYTKAVESLADVVPVGRLASNAIRGITRGRSAGDVGGVLNIRAPQQDALDEAQINAWKSKAEGGLGLGGQNTPMDRARALGGIDVYHGTRQDIQGGMVPGYDDGLIFTTPNAEFASNWIGKGKLQKRKGAEEEQKKIDEYYRHAKKQMVNMDALAEMPAGPEFNAAYDAQMNPFMDRMKQENAIPGRQFGNVLPLTVFPKKTFDPEKNFADIEPFIGQPGTFNAPEAYKRGDYMVYETPQVVNYLKSLGYDSMKLRESSDGPLDTLAMFNANQVRSRFAAFDPARLNESDLLAIQGSSGSSGLDSSNLNRYETEADRRMEIARRNAALPVEQGGLGLPENNTPMDRARAMGYVTPAYHGTDRQFSAFDPAMRGTSTDQGWYGSGEYSAPSPSGADAYAMSTWPDYKQGANILPLLLNNPEAIKNKFGNVTEYVTRDPSQIRSRFAAFDPMRRNEADILALSGGSFNSNLLNINPLLGLLDQ